MYIVFKFYVVSYCHLYKFKTKSCDNLYIVIYIVHCTMYSNLKVPEYLTEADM